MRSTFARIGGVTCSENQTFELIKNDVDNNLVIVKTLIGKNSIIVKFKVKPPMFESTSPLDADSVIYFMQQYNTKKVTIIGDTPQELDNLLITEPEFVAGLNYKNIQRIRNYNYLNYWSSYDTVVYVENNYELLMASTYASLNNAPF